MIEEEERWSELAGSEMLSRELREFLETHGREAVESLPDGIHSGLAREGARGVFFYFRAEAPDGPQHFWRYVDLVEERILDNRHLIASLIACQPDTPRVIDPELWSRVFDLQEEVIADILQSVGDQASLEAAPRVVDPVQQSIATALQAALHRPEVDRERAVSAIRFLTRPLAGFEIKELRSSFREFQRGSDVARLLESIETLREASAGGSPEPPVVDPASGRPQALAREGLRLVCFDLVMGG